MIHQDTNNKIHLKKKISTPRVAFVFGGGGYTGETLVIAKYIGLPHAFIIVSAFKKKSIDEDTVNRVLKEMSGTTEIFSVRNGAFVNSPLRFKIFNTLISFYDSYKLLKKQHIDTILTVGSFLAIPLSICAKITRTRSIYVESLVRVKNLSIVGKLLYHLRLCDYFYIRDKSLHILYPRTLYID